MRLRLYVREGVVFIPTSARTEAGYYLGIEPIEVISASDFDSVKQAIIKGALQANPRIPTPTRANFPTPAILKYANVSSWEAFEHGTSTCGIIKVPDGYRVQPGRKLDGGGWEDDPTKVELWPPETPLEKVASRVADWCRSAR